MLGCYTLVAWMFLLVTASNVVSAAIGYDPDALSGIGVSVCMLFGMILSGVGVIIAAIYGQNYQLLCVVPLKSSTVPMQMSLLVDIVHALCAAANIMIMLLCGYYSMIPMRLVILLALYIIAHCSLSVIVSPGMRNVNFQEANKGKGVLLYFMYLIPIVVIMVLQILMTPEFTAKDSVKLFTMIALPVAAVIAVIARIVTARVIYNKVRVVKVYKKKKAKKQKTESYV